MIMKKETENKIIELHKMVEGFSMDYHQKSLIRDKINEILACEANDRKFGKVDLYDYVCKEKQYPILHGIYHKDGKVYATDARILCRCVCDYDSKYEDKVIDKTGNEIEGRYPNADAVIPNTEGWKSIPADFDKINEARKTWAAHKKLYKKNAKGRFVIGNQEIAMDYLFMMADLMMELGINEFLQSETNYKPLTARDNDNDILIQPTFPYYETWKEHAEAEPEYLFIEL